MLIQFRQMHQRDPEALRALCADYLEHGAEALPEDGRKTRWKPRQHPALLAMTWAQVQYAREFFGLRSVKAACEKVADYGLAIQEHGQRYALTEYMAGDGEQVRQLYHAAERAMKASPWLTRSAHAELQRLQDDAKPPCSHETIIVPPV